ncbi:hypothetical protein [Occallatibacter riparius]|uniref:Uncharacterized protein n=1 Tax=Occallatibacter riparius TaxID=1002689 RepID=A0A9J7BK09_9BACT|nr:hypothetical protein [Occallatibacter riparius]UWZ82114.1 hypothetical protein MOP44_16210 [Occallatibacter riparius]
MSTSFRIPEVNQFLTAPDEAALRRLEAEPMEEPTLEDAEEEEFAELWTWDRGNQGA